MRLSRSVTAKPRWMEVAEAVQAEIDRTKDRDAAVSSVAAHFSIKQDIVNRIMKCALYVAQHHQRGDVVASQTNIEMLMAIEQIDSEVTHQYRASVLSGELSYAEISKTLKRLKRQVERSSVIRESIDDIKIKIFDDLPFLIKKSIKGRVRVDPMWIGADMSMVMKDDQGRRYEWCCVISPFFSASCLRGQGKSSFLRSMASACALFDGVSVMVVDEDEMSWASAQARYITRRIDTLLIMHGHHAPGPRMISGHTLMGEAIGLESRSDPIRTAVIG